MAPDRVLDAAQEPSLKNAADVLAQGGVVGFPTETVYGLGADAFNEKAVCRIFEIKKRPSFDPLIVHVSSPEQAESLWAQTPELARQLMKKFWPGPLTIVLPKKNAVPDVVTSGLPTVAVRMPRHAAALKMINLLGKPVAAPSANLFGYTSPTTAQAVLEDLGERVDLILDGGPAAVGLESTVVKIEEGKLVLLRPGGVPVEELEKFAPVLAAAKKIGAPESPGQLESHYAPWTHCILFAGTAEALSKELRDFQKMMNEKKLPFPRVGLLSFEAEPVSPLLETQEVLSPKKDLYEAASNLFQAIRKLDKMHLDLIVALEVPKHGIGLAIMDRLEKAAAGRQNLQPFFENWNR